MLFLISLLIVSYCCLFFFFFQAEDGIRDRDVTGVQTCALPISRWRTVLGVILPSSMGGILTGTTLAIARVAGETAPLLFTTSLAAMAVTWDPTQPVQSMPLTIFQYAESPDPADHARAWATGIVLLAFVLILSLTSRFFLARSRRKLSR